MIQLDKKYQPQEVEDKWLRHWAEHRLAHADETRDGETFCMVIPPPNITGSLHIGHAFNNTLQDILARWRRMQGKNTLWQPGTDHAGIATQNVVERQLAAEGTTRHDIGRKAFIERVWKWKDESGGSINKQLVRLGCSLDWERDRFTMDEGLSKAVREVFVTLYEDGLIYKGDYIINWCPRCQTALSDLEVEYQERQGHLYHIRYPFQDGDGYVTVATTRPETMLGDTAVAINPEDERHTGRGGKILLLPILNRELPIIEDSYVDTEFGTGALKVTPAHDPNDFELGRRHNLPSINVLHPDGTMNEEAGPFEGQDRFEARKNVVEALKDRDLLEKIEDHTHSVGHCYRCKTVVEPYLSKQWFVKTEPLAKPAIEAVRSEQIKIVPKFWENTYFEWMESIRDWCISRQIWWGHQIPAWTCGDCGEFTVARETPGACKHCGGKKLTQETDVLDTWFSSALWPFSTLGWPEKTETLKKFYPTTVLCTGFDILFFWVARMIMMGLKFQKDIPFEYVYIHALIRDAEGQKMSKTKGNVIDPLVMMDKYGTDALRFTLTAFAAQGRDIKLAEDRIDGYRNFCNKLWNASRFVFMNLEDYTGTCDLQEHTDRSLADRWVLSRLHKTCAEVNGALEAFRFNDAANAIYKFLWNEYCDWYIELSKSRLNSAGPERATTQNVMLYVLESSLKLLHPIMPFITEEIWQKLPREGVSIMVARYPLPDPALNDEDAEKQLQVVMDVITRVRNIRGEMNFNPGQQLDVHIKTFDTEQEHLLQNNQGYIRDLGRVSEMILGPNIEKPKSAASAVLTGLELYVPLKGLMDFDEEKKRVEKELKKIDKDMVFLKQKLSNPNFVDKAPPEVIAKDQQRLEELSEKQAKLQVHLKTIVEATS
ncbi:valine--tRNA ligase [Nitrospina gracilis]|uniref:valine--tRNA ligase n=1 Tax=Nitrospina gracilis TaxID=35801 RepID=UPI001F024117|nr:valine--tRNA ligase [Nitrospina gracilis]MCF8719729.1 valyl-tRNA synthetase [Nitrospina gracilis Nb-211]